MALIKYALFSGLCMLLATCSVLATGFNDKSYLVILNYDAGHISAQPITTVNLPSGYSADHDVGDYALQLKSHTGATLVTKQFAFPLRAHAVPLPVAYDNVGTQLVGLEGQTSTRATVRLSIPYYSEATTMEVYGPDGALKTAIDVSEYVRCNQNAVCEDTLKETAQLCPEDCGGDAPTDTWLYVGFAAVSIFLIIPLFKRRHR